MEHAGRVWVAGGEGEAVVIERGGRLVFGRTPGTGVLGLDPDDLGISARQIEIADEPARLVVRNLSSSRVIAIEYRERVRHARVPPGDLHVLAGSALVLVTGVVRTHAIAIEVPTTDAPTRPLPAGDTSVGNVTLSDLDRDALAALYSGYLQRWPRHRPEPLSYEEAGALLGETAATVRKRVERIRERVNATGVTYIDGRNALRDLADHLIEAGQLHPDDLARLGVASTWRGPVPAAE